MSRRSRTSVRRGEQGQVLLLFVLFFTVIIALSAFAIDQGVWLGHRRVAQKDADVAARAGAAAFLHNLSDFAGAKKDARNLAERNFSAMLPDCDATPTTACANTFAGDGCVDYNGNLVSPGSLPYVEVQINEPTRSLFSGKFGVGKINTGASSIACVGSLTTIGPNPIGAIPVELFNTDFGRPNDCFSAAPPTDPSLGVESNARLGMQCVIKTAAKDPLNGGDRGFIGANLHADECTGGIGASDVKKAIENGLTLTCTIDTNNVCSATANAQDCVNDKPGNVASTLANWNTRLSGAGSEPQTCGAGTFKETFTYGDGSAIPGNIVGPPGLNSPPNTVDYRADPPGTGYALKACQNPRVAFVVLTDDSATHVKGFAGVFIVGCFDEIDPATIDPALSNVLNKCEDSLGIPNGHEEIRAVLLRLVLADGTFGGFGDPHVNPTSPLTIQTTR